MPKARGNASNYVWQPSKKDMDTIKFMLEKFDYCKRLRDKRYPLLGDRTPKQYWDEQEKRFVAFAPPKDVSEEDWQANVVMGITRNAVLAQIAKTGMRVPECHIQDWTKNGFMDTERSRIWQNAYRWSLRRENADAFQQFISLGLYVRGNACLYEGFEDKEVDVEIVEEIDQETGELKTKDETIGRWGPKRQIVPLDEMYYPNFFKNNLKEQVYDIWARNEDYDSLELEFGGYPNWQHVKPGVWSTPQIDDPFFRQRTLLGKRHCFVMRFYGNPMEGGPDRQIVMLNGVPVIDGPLRFNHKRPPFSWTLNEPFSDAFMLGCGVPFKMMDQQDSGDALVNMGLDKQAISMQKPVMTDDPDVRIDNYLYPGAIMKFTKGSTYEMAPIEGVTQGEFNFMQMVFSQAKEFSGAFGGGSGATQRGGKITARQAMMMEEEVKRQLGISMSNQESLERDLCIQRISNLRQFLPGSGKRIEAPETDLYNGKKGRFVAIMAKTLAAAQKMEFNHELSSMEIAGDNAGMPTEAVAIAPEWFDMTDRLEAECVPESSYVRNSTLEQAVADERMAKLIALKQAVPSIDAEEIVRQNMEKHGEDTTRFLSATPPPAAGGQPQPGGGQGGPDLTNQLAGGAPEKSLNSLLGTA